MKNSFKKAKKIKQYKMMMNTIIIPAQKTVTPIDLSSRKRIVIEENSRDALSSEDIALYTKRFSEKVAEEALRIYEPEVEMTVNSMYHELSTGLYKRFLAACSAKFNAKNLIREKTQ